MLTLPHILPLTFKLFFIFTELSPCRDSGPGVCLRKPYLSVLQNRPPFILSVELAVLRQHSEMTACFFLHGTRPVISLVPSSGLTGGLAAPLVAAGAATVIGSAGAAALGSTAGIAVMASLFGAAGAGLTGKSVTACCSATGAQDRALKCRANDFTLMSKGSDSV